MSQPDVAGPKRLALIAKPEALEREDVQLAIATTRRLGHEVEPLPTTGASAAIALAARAAETAHVVVAGGGDGLLSEVASGVLEAAGSAAVLGLVPLGTANDFARGCGFPEAPADALALAASGRASRIDVLDLGGRVGVNVVTAAFVAEDAAALPGELKQVVGSGIYWLEGLFRTLQLAPRRIRWRSDVASGEDELLLLTAANGRQTGGGAVVAAGARLDDGLVDVRLVRSFPLLDLPRVLSELADVEDDPDGYIARWRGRWFEFEADEPWQLTYDGERLETRVLRVEVRPRALPIVLPEGAPLVDAASHG